MPFTAMCLYDWNLCKNKKKYKVKNKQNLPERWVNLVSKLEKKKIQFSKSSASTYIIM